MAGRPTKVVDGEPVHILLSKETATRLDAWVEELRRTVPGGAGITRADLMRDILNKAVDGRPAVAKERKR